MSAFVQERGQIVTCGPREFQNGFLRRGVSRYRELYSSFNETLKSVQAI